jgi:xanthine dehydrogenase small subunit
MRNQTTLYINGVKHVLNAEQSQMMLAEYLRYEKGLTGTKIVCAEGDCGACGVLKFNPNHSHAKDHFYQPVNSCIALCAQLDSQSIVTVDALEYSDRLHETQRAMVECHGSQCGFCTPGFVIAMTGLVEEKIIKKDMQNINEIEAKNCMTGNLCRCTGYAPIINAAMDIDLSKCESIQKRFYSEKQDQDLKALHKEELKIESEHFKFYAPKTIEQAVSYLQQNPKVKIIASATDLGVIHNKRKLHLTHLLSLQLIDNLTHIQEHNHRISIGARVTHTEFRLFIKNRLPELAKYLDIFASPQIKNIATVVGNIANASPIGDTAPALLALDAEVHLLGRQGKRVVALRDFFKAYRQTNRSEDEIITNIEFEMPNTLSEISLYKNSNRKDLDISAMNLAIRIDWSDSQKQTINNVIVAAGGLAATPIRLKKTEQDLKNKNFLQALNTIQSEFTPISDVRASASYRRLVVENLLKRFMMDQMGATL